jgi:hypothetical protein
MNRLVYLLAAAGGLSLTSSCVPTVRDRPIEIAPVPDQSGSPRLTLQLRELAASELTFSPEIALPGPPPFRFGTSNPASFARALHCLTSAVYHEARSEDEDGQRAVAQVVLNRVRHYAYPSTVCGVVYQGAGRSTGCQFTFTCDGSSLRSVDRPAWIRAGRIARAALEGSVYAPVGWATHYHRLDVAPRWSGHMAEIARIGAHVFFRWRGAPGAESAFVRHFAAGEAMQSSPQSCRTTCA